MTTIPNIICECSEIIVKSHNGDVKLRSKILIFKGDQAYAVCKRCNTEVPVPVSLRRTDHTKQANPPLILRT